MKILIAPDKFKHALSASGVADALAAGARDAVPQAEIVTCPLGDGGEGTGSLLAAALGAQRQMATVLDPLGRARQARWWVCRERSLAIIEMAEASGLALLSERRRDPLSTSSFGTGQLVQAAIRDGVDWIWLCVGGSATVDGGAGCLQALGWQLVGPDGQVIGGPATGGMLADLREVRPPTDRPAVTVEVLCDVDNPLLGMRGAARVFGPQKGASSEGVARLERGLANWAALLREATGVDVQALPRGGAAGGLPAGLAAATRAQLVSGFDRVAACVDLKQRLAGCDWCLTGEGRIDEQTVGGKVVAGLARLAGELGVPTIAFAGRLGLAPGQTPADLTGRLGLRRIVVVTPADTPLDRGLAQTAGNLRRAARETLGEMVLHVS